jgi:hypothetical protein
VTETRRLIFDHIPKTAGVSVGAALGERFGTHPPVLHTPHYRLPFDGPSPLLTAHLWYYPGEALRVDWAYATVIRDPVDRAISTFHFLRKVDAQPEAIPDARLAAWRGTTIDEVLDVDHISSLSNEQARHLAARIVVDPGGLEGDDLLDAAITSLDDYDVVGTTGELDAFVARCCAFAGRPGPVDVPRLNTTQRETVSNTTRERLEALNRVDRRLWEHAGRLRDRAGGRRAFGSPSRMPVDFGTREAEVRALNHQADPDDASRAILALDVAVHRRLDDLTIGLELRDGDLVIGANTRGFDVPLPVDPMSRIVVRFELVGGSGHDFSVTAAAHRGFAHTDGCYHWIDPLTVLSISAEPSAGAPRQAELRVVDVTSIASEPSARSSGA